MSEYIGPELTEKIKNPVVFHIVSAGQGGASLVKANGYDATILIDICSAILQAKADGKNINPAVVAQAGIIVGASAKAGIRGLVYALGGHRLRSVGRRYGMGIQCTRSQGAAHQKQCEGEVFHSSKRVTRVYYGKEQRLCREAAARFRMHLTLGHHYHHRDNPLSGQPFTWDPRELINAHMVMTGDSGSGKTHNLRLMCRQMAETAGPGLRRIHVLDSHGDIEVPSSHVQFSQSTPYAFNPLEVNPDPHFGGVRRSVANFLGMIQRSSRKLGTTQESVLRNLLLDVYMSRGFNPDNPATWGLDGGAGRPDGLQEGRIYLDVPFEEKELAKDTARREGATFQFDPATKCWWTSQLTPGLARWPEKTWGKQYPTIHDVISLAQFKLKQIFLGTDQKGLIALEAFCRSQAALLSKIKNTLKRSASEDEEVLQDERDRAAMKAKDAMANFIDRIATGTELEDLIRYESAETLKSLLDRLDNLKATGVCRSVPPPYDEDALVWRYGLRAYGDDEKRMFVENLLERIFQRAVAQGEVDEITDVVIIDEAPKYMIDDSGHIICRIVNEARKFGVALVLVAQTPTQYPEQILAGVGCKIILGLDPMYHRMAANKLALDQKFIEKIQPRKLIFVNQKFKGAVARWAPVQLS